MESTPEHPFGFFDYYLSRGIYKSLDSFYEEGVHNFGEINKVDKNNHLIGVREGEGITTYRFEDKVRRDINPEVQKTIRLLEQEFQKSFLEGNEKKYGEFLRLKYKELVQLQSVTEFPVLITFLEKVLNTINHYSSNSVPTFPDSVLSFNILATTDSERDLKVNKLYDLLSEPSAFIQSDRSEFQKAFTGRPIEEKVKWQVRTRHGHTNKATLFYLIESLAEIGLLQRRPNKELFSQIKYVFVSIHNKELKNLNISHNQMSSSPDRKEDIDSIIEELRSL
ncbi:hypothetical protein [Gramella sp. KN1008]|uniref:hypothetical protein n=1 Tax=Gramella sp. KN1008 TaxID=2529298 RepID=UPI00103CD016|nr:hypothetical protein [Gramella sp. KN1008]TBW25818.1 hypothetical protein EZJ28_14905 [Gramella sp. KN1008]